MAKKETGPPRKGQTRPPLSSDKPTTAVDHQDNPRIGEPQLQLLIASIPKGDGEVRITLDRFKGTPTVDLRTFEPFTMATALMPTRKGVTLGIAKLPALARALADAEAKARELGLL